MTRRPSPSLLVCPAHLRLLAVVLLVCVAWLVFAAHVAGGRPAPAADEPIISYVLSVDVDYEKPFLSVTQTVTVKNPGPKALTSLVFNVMPVYYKAFTLSAATVGDAPANAKLDGTTLDVPLPQPLAPGAAASVTLRWWGQLPAANGRYGAADGIIALGYWYPMLAVLDNGEWQRRQYTVIGDAFYSEVANYDVTLTVNAPVVVAATGTVVSQNGNRWVFRATQARDFALALSNRFKTLSRTVEGVPITVYFTADKAEAAKISLDIADQSLRWYNRKVGPYAFPALAIVQTPEGQPHNSQEQTGLFFLRSDVFSPGAVGIYTAHELAHMWFYAAVGNDQIREPWVDEALVDSISLDFYRETYPKEYPSLWAVWGDVQANTPINRTIFDFADGRVYFATVYRQGATMHRALREAMGDAAYWKGLNAVYEAYKFRILRPQDLVRTLRQAAPQADVLGIARRYMDYPYMKYANLSVGVATPGAEQWAKQVTIPITVTADSPSYTVAVLLDSRPLTTTNRALTVTVDTEALDEGAHTLQVIADDDGLNRVEKAMAFRVERPTPTPSPTATPTITPTPLPTGTPTAAPTAAPQATATPTPQPAAPIDNRPSPPAKPPLGLPGWLTDNQISTFVLFIAAAAGGLWLSSWVKRRMKK